MVSSVTETAGVERTENLMQIAETEIFESLFRGLNILGGPKSKQLPNYQ